MAGWAFDQESEKHAKDIAGRVGCPTEDLNQLVRCMKEVDYSQIVDTHTDYIVSLPNQLFVYMITKCFCLEK